MTYTQFDDPQTCLHKEGKNYMIIMSKKQLQKFKGKKKCWEKTMVKWTFLTIIKDIPGKLTFIEHLLGL